MRMTGFWLWKREASFEALFRSSNSYAPFVAVALDTGAYELVAIGVVEPDTVFSVLWSLGIVKG